MSTLREYIIQKNRKFYEDKANFKPDLGEMWSYTRQIVEGLNHIHNIGVVHRDLKPSNILIGLNDEIKIADFGLAQFSKNSMDESSLVEGISSTRGSTLKDVEMTQDVGTLL
mmetsp:Transcript_100223/g.216184  ORF Transcript_100223/g.216184 Transcript_100223/m.216184 type:complete len:112 (+) Transcript_100223:517-852(+)